MIYPYDTPIEVTEKQRNALAVHAAGIVAHRKDEETGKCFVKVLFMPKTYSGLVKRIIDAN